MGSKTWVRGFFVTILSLLLICAQAYADETSVDDGSEIQKEAAYYTLVDSERYTLILEERVVNNGLGTAYGIDVEIALMDKPTPLYTNRLREQLMPWPDDIKTDEYGRRVAEYHFDELAPGKELLFTQKYVLECSGITYPKLGQLSQGGYDEQLAAQYLLPSPGIESDKEEIINFARQAVGKARDTYGMAKAAFWEINRYMTYVEKDYNFPGRGALRALSSREGVCEDYSKLYVAVLRALGIAARQQSGYLYLPEEHTEPDKEGRLNLGLMRHAWAEFYFPGQGWVIADPTFTYSFLVDGVLTKFPNWDYFAGITKERRYIFFREESLNEKELLEFWVANNGTVVEGFINQYLLHGSQAAFYNDVEGHWAEEAIMRLSERDEPLLQGMGNGMFGVNRPMTRAELVTCMQRLMKSPPAVPKFADQNFSSHWAYLDIGAAQQAGWINGYPDGTFRPDWSVTRAEMAQLLVDVFALSLSKPALEDTEEGAEISQEEDRDGSLAPIAGEDEEPQEIAEEYAPFVMPAEPVFLDLGKPGYAWADEAITTLFLLGFTQGKKPGYYQPELPVTRAEFATFLDRIIMAREQEI